MAMPTYEFELEGAHEGLHEYEGAHEYESHEYEGAHEYEGLHEAHERELEGEYEGEQFLNALRAIGSRAGSAVANFGRQQWNALNTPDTPQRRFAIMAANKAVDTLPGIGGWAGKTLGSLGSAIPYVGPVAGPALGALGGVAGTALGKYDADALRRLIPLREYEALLEYEGEGEGELSPIRRVYVDAMMEHLAHAAAETESEAEVGACVRAMIPLVARNATPHARRALARTAPALARGVTNIARTLHRSPKTRPLARVMPTVLRRTAADIGRQVAAGQRVTPQTAVRTLARQTYGVLSSPRQCIHAFRRSQALDRRAHKAGIARLPTGAPRRSCPTCGR